MFAQNAYGFRVNNKIHAFDKPLQNGDIIEVITKRTSQPKQAWRQLVTTTTAKNKLQAQLRQSNVIIMINNATNIIRRKSKHE